MNNQAKSNPETDTMGPEEMARYLTGLESAVRPRAGAMWRN